ncbi:hypothetical protein M408DRAFT_325508 [Serendipita vermifera MAFF 305830]|uniref:Uncharacterized protein n=1 Tax=Serendipita vermifera MAFF 305830 TaxID=933852 RepID=A0A0C2XYL9_SERVB|nr:hypothetical protein M408DRAFT_325508 [Serendipita vermifera MAFF 305830]
MAQAHEQLAYHRFNTRQPMYQFNTFAEDDASAWDGPNPVNETWAWLREQEFKAYNDKKNAEWNKQNPGWDKYNPEEDEFLHPHLRDTSKKPSRRKLPKNAATALDTKKRQQQRKKPDDQEDFDSVKGIRAGLGFYLHDPLPKPQRDITPWIASLRDASREENYAPRIQWNEKFATEPSQTSEVPLTAQVTSSLLVFGQKYCKYTRMNDKKREAMHLFLELPTAEKVRRIELLALKLCDPGSWNTVIDQPEYWN